METGTILIIDDSPQNLKLLTDLLTKCGYKTIAAEDGPTGLFRAEHAQPDLILLDVLMPGMDGIETCWHLKKNPKTKNIPVIITTALSDTTSKIASFEAGAVDFITKPLQHEEVLARVRVHIQNQQLINQINKINTLMTSVFTSIQDGILVFNTKNQLIDHNSSSIAIICADNLMGSNPTCTQVCLDIIKETQNTNSVQKKFRLECQCADKKLILNLTASPLLDSAKNNIGTVLMARDVTRLSALESSVQKRRHFSNIIGENPQMYEIYSLINDIAPTNSTTLITGESGTGKELVAQAIHSRSTRSDKPFVTVNCGAISKDLIESELFGHKKGSFTGALHDRPGLFEQANTGTLFLDEVGELPLQMQVKLLRVLQEREIRMVGDTIEKKIDVRIIAATNNELENKIRDGQFREDLYYRLNVFNIHLPPLRQRADDIPLIAGYLVSKICNIMGKDAPKIADDTMELLTGYAWPGNIRELHNTIEHSIVRCHGPLIAPEHLPIALQSVPEVEYNRIRILDITDALKAAGGNKAKAARLLGIDRKTIYRKLESME